MPSKRSLYRALERERERHAQIEARLIDQILHLSGKPWTPAPADMTPTVEPVVQVWTAAPEQHPLD